MSDKDSTESKLGETYSALESAVDASFLKAAQMRQEHGSALAGFCLAESERISQYGLRRFEAGVEDERMRVFRLWKEFHDWLSECSVSEKVIERRLLILGEEILDKPMASQSEVVDPPIDAIWKSNDTGEDESACDSLGVYEKKEPVVEDKLMSNIVKLMAKAGTRRNGLKAGWTIEEILYGLKMVMPSVQTESIDSAIVCLKENGVVEDFNGGRSGIRIYCLGDDYAAGPEEVQHEDVPSEKPSIRRQQELRRDLGYVLRSNTDTNGKLMPWKTNSLFYALRDNHPWVTKGDIIAAASSAEWCEEVAPGVYQFVEVPSSIPQVVMSPKSPSTDSVHGGNSKAPRWYREGTPEQREAIANDPGILIAGSPPEAQIDDVTPAGIVEAADAIYEILRREAAGGQRRIWKEYDIIGLLGRGAELGVKLKDEYLSRETLAAAMDFLVVDGKLEAVPMSPERPWIKQPGWMLAK